MKRVGRGREIDGRPRFKIAVRRVAEIEVTQRTCQGLKLPPRLAFEKQHVLVLMVQNDALQLIVQAVFRSVSGGGLSLRADRTGGHVIAAVHPGDAGVLNPVLLVGSPGREGFVIMNRHDRKAIGAHFNRQQP